MEHRDGDCGRKLLLLAQDDAWRDMTIEQATLAIAPSPDDAVQSILTAGHPYSHVLVEPILAAGWLPRIVGAIAQRHPAATLVLLGEDTAESHGVAAVRLAGLGDLQGLFVGREDHSGPALTLADIAAAFDAGQVDCQYQPIVRLTDGALVGVEALARLEHPERGTLTPDMFVPQAETSGLSMRLAEIVLQAALHGIDRSFLEHHGVFLTVNLPLDVVLLAETLPLLESYRRAAGIAVGTIVIELTESRPVLDIPQLREALHHWREAGYRLAIDDMGPEMVNQTRLFGLPFHLVKLDKGAVLRSRDNALAQSYLRRTIAAGQAHGLRIIAEGIEDPAQWAAMRDLGVDYAQGFLIGHAMPAAALPAWLDTWDGRFRGMVREARS